MRSPALRLSVAPDANIKQDELIAGRLAAANHCDCYCASDGSGRSDFVEKKFPSAQRRRISTAGAAAQLLAKAIVLAETEYLL
jgi:hypothetical protein